VIRNVCIHVSNEQPLLADLYALPSASDAGLVCTNVRSMDGKKPIFVDQTASTFFFPYHVVRFLEIPDGEMAKQRAMRTAGMREGVDTDPYDDADDARTGEGEAHRNGNGHGAHVDPESLLPVAVGAPMGLDADDGDGELEIDEDFLQRIRDI
jgi:hypothetical protein